MKRLKIFTWHVHGNYLYYLSQCELEFYIPVAADRRAGYGGRGETFPFGRTSTKCPKQRFRSSTLTAYCSSRAKTTRSTNSGRFLRNNGSFRGSMSSTTRPGSVRRHSPSGARPGCSPCACDPIQRADVGFGGRADDRDRARGRGA